MKFFRQVLFVSVAILAGVCTANGATINVPSGQPTIQAGINAAINGDTVLVSPGTYVESLIVVAKNISIIGALGSGSTVLSYPVRVTSILHVTGGTDTTFLLSGFTIQNVDHGDLAAVQIDNSSASIRNCRFVRNTNYKPSGSSWGAVGHFGTGTMIVENCYFLGNTSYGAAGVGLAGKGGRINNCVFIADTAFGDFAGAIGQGGVNPADSLFIENNFFLENVAPDGGALFINSSTNVFVRGNTFVRNKSTSGDGGAICVWFYVTGAVIENNIFYQNTGHAVTNIHGSSVTLDCNNAFANTPIDYSGAISAGPNAYSADPLFCSDPVDFRLSLGSPSTAANAPCGIRTGAYGLCVNTCALPGDSDGDGAVTIGDAVFLIAYIFLGGVAPGCFVP